MRDDHDDDEAAEVLGLSERSVWRLKGRFSVEGPAGLVHGNRGRPSPRRIGEQTRERVRALARGRYDGANDCHLSELLAEREAISLSRVSVRRILGGAGIASPRRRRASTTAGNVTTASDRTTENNLGNPSPC